MKIKTVSVFLSVCFVMLVAGCSSKGEKGEDRNKAFVTLANRSNTNKSYDALWDGSRVAVLRPDDSYSFETAPGAHTFQFKVTNTGQPACNQASPNLAAGQVVTYSCSF